MAKEVQGKVLENGMHFSDRCQFCGDFGEKVEPYLCSRCAVKVKELGYRKLIFTLLEIQHLIVALKGHYKDEWCTECESVLPKLEALKSELEVMEAKT